MQLSPIQCTYSNIFIRFFKFFPANTNIYQNSYRVIGANCAVEIALSGRQCSLLCLFAPFPHGYTVSRGVPDNCTFEITLLQAIMLTLMLVCAFSSASYASFLTRQSSQATNVCLTLAYSFSHRVHSIPLGAHYTVSCVGFIIWFPSGRCVVCFSFDQPTVASNSRLSYACILLFPTGTQYPAGSPYFRSQ